jgi:hypothetical protein
MLQVPRCELITVMLFACIYLWCMFRRVRPPTIHVYYSPHDVRSDITGNAKTLITPPISVLCDVMDECTVQMLPHAVHLCFTLQLVFITV